MFSNDNDDGLGLGLGIVGDILSANQEFGDASNIFGSGGQQNVTSTVVDMQKYANLSDPTRIDYSKLTQISDTDVYHVIEVKETTTVDDGYGNLNTALKQTFLDKHGNPTDTTMMHMHANDNNKQNTQYQPGTQTGAHSTQIDTNPPRTRIQTQSVKSKTPRKQRASKKVRHGGGHNDSQNNGRSNDDVGNKYAANANNNDLITDIFMQQQNRYNNHNNHNNTKNQNQNENNRQKTTIHNNNHNHDRRQANINGTHGQNHNSSGAYSYSSPTSQQVLVANTNTSTNTNANTNNSGGSQNASKPKPTNVSSLDIGITDNNKEADGDEFADLTEMPLFFSAPFTPRTALIIDNEQQQQLKTDSNSNSSSDFNFNAWIIANGFESIRSIFVKHKMTTKAVLSVSDPAFARLVSDPDLFSQSTYIQSVIAALQALQSESISISNINANANANAKSPPNGILHSDSNPSANAPTSSMLSSSASTATNARTDMNANTMHLNKQLSQSLAQKLHTIAKYAQNLKELEQNYCTAREKQIRDTNDELFALFTALTHALQQRQTQLSNNVQKIADKDAQKTKHEIRNVFNAMHVKLQHEQQQIVDGQQYLLNNNNASTSTSAIVTQMERKHTLSFDKMESEINAHIASIEQRKTQKYIQIAPQNIKTEKETILKSIAKLGQIQFKL